MMTISITAEVGTAIERAFSGDWSADVRPDDKGVSAHTTRRRDRSLGSDPAPGRVLFGRYYPPRERKVLAPANVDHPVKRPADCRLRFFGFLLGLVQNREERDAAKVLNLKIETRDATFGR